MELGDHFTVEEIRKLAETEEGRQQLRELVDPEDREKFEEILKAMVELQDELKSLDKEMEDTHGLYTTNQEGEA